MLRGNVGDNLKQNDRQNDRWTVLCSKMAAEHINTEKYSQKLYFCPIQIIYMHFNNHTNPIATHYCHAYF